MRHRSWLAGLASKIFPRRFAAAKRAARRRPQASLRSFSDAPLATETLEPMREFMSGKGVEIYTEGTTFLAEQGANLRGWAEPVVPARHPLTNARPSKPAATYPGDSIMRSIPLLPNVKGDSRTSVR